MAPNEGIEFKAIGSVHLSLQGKGGVGRSPFASVLPQYLNCKALAVGYIDSDPVSKSRSQYRGLRTAPLPLLCDGGIDQRAFDGLMEELLTTDGLFVVDSGATTFIPLWNYILENNGRELLRAADKRLLVHTVITGGQALAEMLNCFGQLAESTSDQNIAVWVDEYFGRVERDGKEFLECIWRQQNSSRPPDGSWRSVADGAVPIGRQCQ